MIKASRIDVVLLYPLYSRGPFPCFVYIMHFMCRINHKLILNLCILSSFVFSGSISMLCLHNAFYVQNKPQVDFKFMYSVKLCILGVHFHALFT